MYLEIWRKRGGLAQLGERLPCKQEVSGSIPLISTTSKEETPRKKRRADPTKWSGAERRND